MGPDVSQAMTTIKWLLVIAVALYGGLLALMYFAQRALMYFPDTRRTPPATVGLPQAEEVTLNSADGEQVIAWHVPPRGDAPVVLYFHGNGAALANRAGRFQQIVSDGTGLLALSYRGYGGSSGRPSEDGLIMDAEAAYQFAAARYPNARLVLWGESLGTGVAVAVAAKHRVAALVLEAPFTSAVEIAASSYPFAPVRWLMKDQFRSDQRIGKVTAPVLILHGDHDAIVPFELGKRLFALTGEPKRFVRLPGRGHNDLDNGDILAAVRAFLEAKTGPQAGTG
jgi:fermentation-respiration switch protein FrsA (DUF1100 family)